VKSNSKDIELLNELLHHRLDKTTIEVMNKRLANETDLLEDYEFLKATTLASRVLTLQSKLKMLKDEEEIISAMNPRKAMQWWWVLAVVATIVLLMFTWKYTQSSKTREANHPVFASDFDSKLVLHKTYRSEINQEELSLDQQRAYELYSFQLFSEAIPLLESVWTQQKDTLALFYLGVSYFGVGKEEKGREVLNVEALSKYAEKDLLLK
jgi:hypothetical protein